MTDDLNRVLRECALELLETGRPKAADIVRCARERMGAAMEASTFQLVEAAMLRRVKHMVRDLVGEDVEPGPATQMDLPGLEPPMAIAIPTASGDFELVLFSRATWADLVAHREEKRINLARAEARLKDVQQKMDHLRPVMESDPLLTVEGAIARLREVPKPPRRLGRWASPAQPPSLAEGAVHEDRATDP